MFPLTFTSINSSTKYVSAIVVVIRINVDKTERIIRGARDIKK